MNSDRYKGYDAQRWYECYIMATYVIDKEHASAIDWMEKHDALQKRVQELEQWKLFAIDNMSAEAATMTTIKFYQKALQRRKPDENN
jgi:hypothetical protein